MKNISAKILFVHSCKFRKHLRNPIWKINSSKLFSVHYEMHLGCCIYLSLPTPPSRPSWKLEIESDCKIPCCLIKTHTSISYWSDDVKWLIDWSACNIGIEKLAPSNYAAKVVEDWFLLSIGICISQVRGTRKGSVNIGVYEGNSRGIGVCGHIPTHLFRDLSSYSYTLVLYTKQFGKS